MSQQQPVPLTPILVAPDNADYRSLLTWPFSDQPFFEGQVRRLLQLEIPQRILFGATRIWVYRDPTQNMVGFGTLQVSNEYEQFTGGHFHSYIPLLAVNPVFQKRGHGRSIVEHLIAEAVLLRMASNLSDHLFLDVYTANKGAIALYEKCGFAILNPHTPIADPLENNETFFVMAKKIAAPGT